MDLSELNLDIRAFNAVCRAGFKTAEELFQAIGENQESVRLLVGRSNFDRIDEAFAELEDKGMLDFTTKLPPAPAEETTSEYLEAFNLNARIHYCKDSVERGLAEMCILIEQMRNGKQYKALGYSNFEEYCKTEFGFSDRQGRKYADVGKMLGTENRNSSSGFGDIGINKLHLLAKLDEPTRETVTETIDVESVTVKELKAQITALTAERDEKEEQLQSKHNEWLHSCNENAKLHERIIELEDQVEDLENKPVDHIVVPSPDQSREIELLENDIRQMDKENSINLQKIQDDHHRFIIDLNRKHNAEVAELKTQLQKAGSGDDEKEQAGRFHGLYEVFQDVVDSLEMLIEDMDDKEKSRFLSLVDEYYRKNLLYLVPEVET